MYNAGARAGTRFKSGEPAQVSVEASTQGAAVASAGSSTGTSSGASGGSRAERRAARKAERQARKTERQARKKKDDSLFIHDPGPTPPPPAPAYTPASTAYTSPAASTSRATSDAGERSSRLPKWARACLGIVAFVAVVLALAAVLRTFVLGTHVVPTASMADTIEVGDLVVSEKVSYWFDEPEAGDIVTFTVYAETVDGEPVVGTISLEPGEGLEEVELVKRVIATAGQTVELVDGAVYVDGELLEEGYVDSALTEELAGSSIEFPYTVPEGEVWVMGDNRTNSADSRWFGSIPVESVTGRVFFCYWPWDRIGVVE